MGWERVGVEAPPWPEFEGSTIGALQVLVGRAEFDCVGQEDGVGVCWVGGEVEQLAEGEVEVNVLVRVDGGGGDGDREEVDGGAGEGSDSGQPHGGDDVFEEDAGGCGCGDVWEADIGGAVGGLEAGGEGCGVGGGGRVQEEGVAVGVL